MGNAERPMAPWEMEHALVNEARAIHAEGFAALLQKIQTAFPSSFFPARITQELLHNPQLSIAMLINSSTSPALYKSILNDCDRVTAPIDATKETKDIKMVLTAIANDPLFATIDDTAFRSFAVLVASKGQLSDLTDIRAQILSQCTPQRFSLLSTQFIESVYHDQLTEDVARKTLQSLLRTHSYPFFDQHRFLVWLLSMASERSLHEFLLKDFLRFVPSAFQRADTLCAIADRAPYDFPVFYFKNRYRLLNGIDVKWSCATQAGQLHKACYQRLTLVQKLISGIPILL